MCANDSYLNGILTTLVFTSVEKCSDRIAVNMTKNGNTIGKQDERRAGRKGMSELLGNILYSKTSTSFPMLLYTMVFIITLQLNIELKLFFS